MGRKLKQIGFNLETEKELLAKAELMPNFSYWVKEKLREQIFMEKIQGNKLSPMCMKTQKQSTLDLDESKVDVGQFL